MKPLSRSAMTAASATRRCEIDVHLVGGGSSAVTNFQTVGMATPSSTRQIPAITRLSCVTGQKKTRQICAGGKEGR